MATMADDDAVAELRAIRRTLDDVKRRLEWVLVAVLILMIFGAIAAIVIVSTAGQVTNQLGI
jgi:hypothetical protein